MVLVSMLDAATSKQKRYESGELQLAKSLLEIKGQIA
jgi:hypothetical protein